jgi:hypothetical protein
MIDAPRFEDYEIKYENKANMFAFMGLGFTKSQVMEGDLSPYMSHDVLEKKFYDFRLTDEEESRLRARSAVVNEGPGMA